MVWWKMSSTEVISDIDTNSTTALWRLFRNPRKFKCRDRILEWVPCGTNPALLKDSMPFLLAHPTPDQPTILRKDLVQNGAEEYLDVTLTLNRELHLWLKSQNINYELCRGMNPQSSFEQSIDYILFTTAIHILDPDHYLLFQLTWLNSLD
jgi:hypothetical protein